MTWHPEILQHYALTTTELAYMPPGTVVANLHTGDRYHATNPKPHSTDIWQIINPYNGLPEPELRTLTDTPNDWYSIAPYGLALPASLTPKQLRQAPLGTLVEQHEPGARRTLDSPQYLAVSKSIYSKATTYAQVDPNTMKTTPNKPRLDADTHHTYRPPRPTRILNQYEIDNAPIGTRVHDTTGNIIEAVGHGTKQTPITIWADVEPLTNRITSTR